MYRDQMNLKLLELEKQIYSITREIQILPDGTLYCIHNGKYQKWYSYHNKRQTYIPKSNQTLAEKIAYKKYLSLLLEDLTQEKKAIEAYLSLHPSDFGKSNELLIQKPEYRELLSNYLHPLSQELLEWANSPYEKNPNYPEQLIHKTRSGNYVRSKSEIIIDMLLHMNQIPFHYENALYLNKTVIYPDFTIRHPKTGKFFYWEHFGLMDNPTYANKTCEKLQLYTSNGIIPSIQLITTYETKDHPLTYEVVEQLIKHYFL